MAILRVRARVSWIAVVGVDHVAGGAATGAVIAGVIIGAGKRKDGIEKAGLLEAEKDGIGAQSRAQAAITQFIVGLAWSFFEGWVSNFGFFPPTLFEDTQDVTGLGSFPAIQRHQFRQNALATRFLRCG